MRMIRPVSLQKVLSTAALSLVLAFGASTTGMAQDAAPPSDEQVATGLSVWKDNGCFNCHGDFGEGGEGGHFPAGPSLRATTLDPTSLKEVIACGLPGTLMPYNAAGAYTTRECYGITTGAPAEVTPGSALTEEQIDNLVAYMTTWVVGQRPRITLEQCTFYFGDANDPHCVGLR